MTDFSKFANIHELGSAVDEYNVVRTKYVANIGFKSFEVPSVPLEFNMDSSNSNVGKSTDILLQIEALKFVFEFECDETFSGRGWCTYKLFMKVIDTNVDADGPEGWSTYVEVLVLTECPCLLPNQSCYDGPYAVLEMTPSSPVEIFTHKHNYRTQQLPGIMTVKFAIINISQATLIPLEVLKLISKNKCIKTLDPVIKECEKAPPEITIVCKGEYKLLAHKRILMARTPVLRSLFEALPELTKLCNQEFSTFATKVILHFIYTGTLQEDWMKDVHGVINAAKEYQLLELMEFFENYLIKTCNDKNAFMIFRVAEKYSMKHSLQYALKTMQKNSC